MSVHSSRPAVSLHHRRDTLAVEPKAFADRHLLPSWFVGRRQQESRAVRLVPEQRRVVDIETVR
jgi:hypothetical protein